MNKTGLIHKLHYSAKYRNKEKWSKAALKTVCVEGVPRNSSTELTYN